MRRLLVVLALFSLSTVAFADADLHVVVNFPPAGSDVPVPAGSQSNLELTIFNVGPDVARGVMATIDLPSGVTLENLGDSLCTFPSPSQLRCPAGDLQTAGETSTARFQFTPQFPLAEGKHTITVTASSSTPDPKSDNDRITATYATAFLADLHVRSEPGYVRADPGGNVALSVSVDNFLPTIDPDEVRVHFRAVNGRLLQLTGPQGWSCSRDDREGECVAKKLNKDCQCSGTFVVRVEPSLDRNGGQSQLIVTATSNLPEQYEGNNTATTTIETYRWITVTNTNDFGAGSLRAAIEQANACGSKPCKIAFEIAGSVPSAGWFTIEPATPLPTITAERVFVDGATQTKFSGDTNPRGPEVAIDGRLTASGHGLAIGSRCESQIQHLAIGNFRGHGIVSVIGAQCLSPNIEARRIAHNYVGVDPSGTVARPNLRGVEVHSTGGPFEITENVISGNSRSGVWSTRGGLYVRRNRIGTTADGTGPLPNGASGVYLGPAVGVAEVLENTISYNREMGVAIAPGADQIEVRQNAMRDNGGLGIDWELDGVSPQRNDEGNAPSNAPVLLAARYDAARNRTIVTMKLQTGPFGPYGSRAAILDFYRNDKPDGDGEQYVNGGGTYAFQTNGETFDVEILGDHRGKWLNATSTRVYFLFSNPPDDDVASQGYAGGVTRTSELSNAILVTP
ncbi:MAG TPA: right-handed parallel beta-helix repeat-containing protein [Thermoanaerobaculia bacterium]